MSTREYTVDEDGAVHFPVTGHIYRVRPQTRGRPAIRLDITGEPTHVARLDLLDDRARRAFAAQVNGRAPAGAIEEELAVLAVLWEAGQAQPRTAAADQPAPSAIPVEETDAPRDERQRRSQATKLVELTTALGVELFHTPELVPYASFEVGSGNDAHLETWPLHVKGFKQWFERQFYLEHGSVPGSQAVQDALGVLAGRARYEGPEWAVGVRTAEHEGAIYLDLADERWRAVEVTPSGWRVVPRPPVRFRRARGMLALPEPVRGGDATGLRPFLNVGDDADFLLALGWLVQALRPRGPYPVLALLGGQGSAKSTTARVLKALTDPNVAPLRAEPKEPRDLMIAATNSWALALDNLSHLPIWLSDALCRLSTGGGFSTRELYSDDEERIFEATRPLVLTGIEEFVVRPDLLDRSLLLYLPRIPDEQRCEEEVFWRQFEQVRPAVLGALLNGVSGALRGGSRLRFSRLPRLADFARWAAAAMPAFGATAADFVRAYDRRRSESNVLPLEASPIVPHLQRFAEQMLTDGRNWSGTATDLLDELVTLAGDAAKRKGWPGDGRVLSNMLRRLAPNLRAAGLEISFERENHTGRRLVVLSRVAEQGGADSVTCVTSVTDEREEPDPGDADGGEGGAVRVRRAEPASPNETQSTPGTSPGDTGDTGDAGSGAGSADVEATCCICGTPAWAASAEGTPYCERHATSDEPPPDGGGETPNECERASVAPARGDGGSVTVHRNGPEPAGRPSVPIGWFKPACEAILVGDQDALAGMLRTLARVAEVGFDSETTGLDPHRDRLRLLQFATPQRVYVVDCFAVPPQALAPLFDRGPCLIGHNLAFDLRFLMAAGLPVPASERLFDTMLASQLLLAGLPQPLGTHTLAGVVERELGLALDKREQRSDWSGVLTQEQVAYAATDAAVLLPLAERLRTRLAEAELARVLAIELGALPAVAWLEQSGAPFDALGWRRLSDAAVTEQVRLEDELTALAGTCDLFGKSTINWASSDQVARVLRQRGHEVDRTDEQTLRAIASVEPLAPLLHYRDASRRASAYGIEFLQHLHPRTGRIHASYRQIGAASGRMACSDPNLQNIPRDPAYRACFHPAPGRVLVKADYSQIELRIAAQVSRDEALLAAYRAGADVHARTAAAVTGSDVVTKAQRQLAKALNFGLTYGMGAQRLVEYAASNYGVQLSQREAATFREHFFRAYPGLRRWHRRVAEGEVETRTLTGRRRLGVGRFTEKLNSPVQGTGADILKLALGRLWADRAAQPGAYPVLCVHDEIVVECAADQAPAVAVWLKGHMEAAGAELLRDVPVTADVTIATNWSGETTANAAS